MLKFKANLKEHPPPLLPLYRLHPSCHHALRGIALHPLPGFTASCCIRYRVLQHRVAFVTGHCFLACNNVKAKLREQLEAVPL